MGHKYTKVWKAVLFSSTLLGEVSALAEDSEIREIPISYGEQDVGRLHADLQRLQKFVYRKLGADRLNLPVEKAANTTEANEIEKGQMEILQRKVEAFSEELPTLLNRLEEEEHKVRKLLENNKTMVDYITHFKKEFAALEERYKALEGKLDRFQEKETIPSFDQPKSVEEEIPSLPPLVEGSKPIDNLSEAALSLGGSLDTLSPEPIFSTEELEKKAKASLLSAQYEEAQKFFEEILSREMTQEQESNARFYLGEIAHLKKNYAKAAEHYLLAYQKHPKGQRAPRSLLKLASALHLLEKKKEACVALRRIETDYPTAEETVLRMARDKQKEYACSF